MRYVIATVGIVALVAACAGVEQEPEPEPQQICTLIGCNDGLSVQVTSAVTQSITVTVRANNQVLRTFRCDPGNPCASFIENQMPASVSVTVEAPGGTVNRAYTPEYRTARPNGPNCPPACRQATITVAVS
jgi:hypothetical protein